MCGIFGMTSQFASSNDDDSFIKHSLIAGSVRGLDGTGIIFCDMDGTTNYLKSCLNGASFVNEYYDPTCDTKARTHSFICHNRAATMGTITDDTAHPFLESNIIGVHNGTLRGNWKADLQVSAKTDVDSRAIFRTIAARGIDWTVKNLDGAAALVWVDIRTQKIFVWRNSERPLCYMESGNNLYFASEMGMLAWLAHKNRIRVEKIESFKTEMLYEITGGAVTEEREIRQPVYNAPNWYDKGAYSQYSNGYVKGGRNLNNVPLLTKDTPISLPPKVEEVKPAPKAGGGGLNYQNGVAFRGVHVTDAEKANGIVAEYAERGSQKYECLCCEDLIDGPNFYESISDGEIKVHEGCLDMYRCEYDADDPVQRIVRDPTFFQARRLYA